LGPYEVDNVLDNGSVRLKTIDDEGISFLTNGNRLRLYKKPISREEFVQDLIQQSEMEVVSKRVIPLSSTSS
jgi:hypothetical protein